MTIITKAIGEKKGKNGDKLEQPLVVEIPVNGANAGDPEAQHGRGDYVVRQRYLILTRHALRPSAVTTLCLGITALIVMIIGFGGGACLYKLYAREQMHRFRTGWYSIPYDSANKLLTPMQSNHEYLNDLSPAAFSDVDRWLTNQQNNDMLDFEKIVERTQNYFRERFEMDLDHGYYEKIDVPDFRNGRQGRFIHDFNMNKTGIVDIDGHCCFVMPLNRQSVLPPRNMYDLLQKLYNGYYEVDTGIVRQTMRVVTPPISDLTTVGAYIARECHNMTTYLLQPVNNSVYKRSAADGVYGVFAGKHILELEIVNVQDIITNQKK